jgi:uncharacterized protein DUF4823
MKVLLIVSIGIFLSGCAATYNQQILKSPTSKLERDKGVFISTPKNGWYVMTANALKAAFSRFSNNIYISEDCSGLECLKIIPTEKYAYFAEPDILHWEDRATEWSGLPDRIEVKISIYDAALGAEIASAVKSGKSKWATFGGDHPEDLLPWSHYTRGLRDWLKRFFRTVTSHQICVLE